MIHNFLFDNGLRFVAKQNFMMYLLLSRMVTVGR